MFLHRGSRILQIRSAANAGTFFASKNGKQAAAAHNVIESGAHSSNVGVDQNYVDVRNFKTKFCLQRFGGSDRANFLAIMHAIFPHSDSTNSVSPFAFLESLLKLMSEILLEMNAPPLVFASYVCKGSSQRADGSTVDSHSLHLQVFEVLHNLHGRFEI